MWYTLHLEPPVMAVCACGGGWVGGNTWERSYILKYLIHGKCRQFVFFRSQAQVILNKKGNRTFSSRVTSRLALKTCVEYVSQERMFFTQRMGSQHCPVTFLSPVFPWGPTVTIKSIFIISFSAVESNVPWEIQKRFKNCPSQHDCQYWSANSHFFGIRIL